MCGPRPVVVGGFEALDVPGIDRVTFDGSTAQASEWWCAACDHRGHCVLVDAHEEWVQTRRQYLTIRRVGM